MEQFFLRYHDIPPHRSYHVALAGACFTKSCSAASFFFTHVRLLSRILTKCSYIFTFAPPEKVAELEHKYANIKHLVRGRKEPQKPSKSARMKAEQMLCLRTHYYSDESVIVAWVCV